MASRVISIEIGYSLTKICEVDYKVKNPKVYSSFTLETPEGIILDGVLSPTEEFVETIKSQISAKGIKTKQAVITVTSTKIASREINIPIVKENKISTLVRANASDYFPVDLADYELAHIVMGTIGEGDTQQYKVLVLAAPKTLLEPYHVLADTCGLSLVALDYSGNSIYQVVKNECAEGVQAVIKIDERASIATVMEDGNIVLQRNISYGINDAIETMIRSKSFEEKTYTDALATLRRKTCIYRSMKYDEMEDAAEDDIVIEDLESNELLKKGRADITDTFRYLIGGIIRVIDYYNSNNKEKPISKIYITGIGADFSGLSKLLTSELGVKTVVLTKVEGFNIDKSFREASFGEYIACLGAAIAPLGFMPDDKKAKAGTSSTSIDKEKIGYLLFAAGLLIAIVLIAVSAVRLGLTKHAYNQKMTELNSLAYVEEDYLKYLNTEVVYNEVDTMYGYTKNSNEQLNTFLQELQDKMPVNIQITSMNASLTDVNLNIQVPSKEAMANIILQLRDFDCFSNIVVSGASDTEDETGAQVVAFSVTGTYKTEAELAAEAAAQETAEANVDAETTVDTTTETVTGEVVK